MSRRLVIVAMMAVIVSGAVTPAIGGGLKIADWSYMAPIQMKKEPGKGAAVVDLSPEVLDLSEPDLRDLRVVAGEAEEIGYVARTETGAGYSVQLDARLYNRTNLPGKESSVLVEFGNKVLKNRISVKTPGTNFRRKIRIEGSDDEQTWRIVRDGAFLFRVSETDEKGPAYDKNTVPFPDNNQRYLRITVYHGPDDPDVVPIEEVKAWQQVRTPPRTADVPVVNLKTEQKKRATEITVDLGFRNMALHRLELAYSDENFFRRVAVFGRNAETRVVRTVVEDSPALEKKVPVSWTRITKGTVYRFSGAEASEDSLAVDLGAAKYRYLRVRIENFDDPPLHVTGVHVDRLLQAISFGIKEGEEYTLYFGNSKAERPVYDISHYVGRLQKQGVAQAILGKPLSNPAHKITEKVVPWSERHKMLIWIALLVMILALGSLIYRMVRSARVPEG